MRKAPLDAQDVNVMEINGAIVSVKSVVASTVEDATEMMMMMTMAMATIKVHKKEKRKTKANRTLENRKQKKKKEEKNKKEEVWIVTFFLV